MSVLPLIRQVTGGAAHRLQFPLTSLKNRPWIESHSQFDAGYSSGAPKMCPVSCPKTLSMDVQVSKVPLVRRMTTLRDPAVA